jgi:hypothetical protein
MRLRKQRMFYRSLALIVLVGLVPTTLVGCQTSSPTQPSSQAPVSPSQSPSQSASPEAPGVDALPLTKSELIGTWKTVNLPDEAASYRYVFREDGTFAVYETGSNQLVLSGEYLLDQGNDELRLHVRDPQTNELRALARLRPVAKKGGEEEPIELIFEQLPDQGTLWLRRLKGNSSDQAPSP